MAIPTTYENPISQLEPWLRLPNWLSTSGYDDEVVMAAFFHDCHLCDHASGRRVNRQVRGLRTRTSANVVPIELDESYVHACRVQLVTSCNRPGDARDRIGRRLLDPPVDRGPSAAPRVRADASAPDHDPAGRLGPRLGSQYAVLGTDFGRSRRRELLGASTTGARRLGRHLTPSSCRAARSFCGRAGEQESRSAYRAGTVRRRGLDLDRRPAELARGGDGRERPRAWGAPRWGGPAWVGMRRRGARTSRSSTHPSASNADRRKRDPPGAAEAPLGGVGSIPRPCRPRGPGFRRAPPRGARRVQFTHRVVEVLPTISCLLSLVWIGRWSAARPDNRMATRTRCSAAPAGKANRQR